MLSGEALSVLAPVFIFCRCFFGCGGRCACGTTDRQPKNEGGYARGAKPNGKNENTPNTCKGAHLFPVLLRAGYGSPFCRAKPIPSQPSRRESRFALGAMRPHLNELAANRRGLTPAAYPPTVYPNGSKRLTTGGTPRRANILLCRLATPPFSPTTHARQGQPRALISRFSLQGKRKASQDAPLQRLYLTAKLPAG